MAQIPLVDLPTKDLVESLNNYFEELNIARENFEFEYTEFIKEQIAAIQNELKRRDKNL